MYQNLTEDMQVEKNMFIPLQKMVSLLILAHFRIVSPKTCTQNVPFFNLESPIFFLQILKSFLHAIIHQLRCQGICVPTQKLEVI